MEKVLPQFVAPNTRVGNNVNANPNPSQDIPEAAGLKVALREACVDRPQIGILRTPGALGTVSLTEDINIGVHNNTNYIPAKDLGLRTGLNSTGTVSQCC